MTDVSKDLLNLIAQTIFEKKGSNIVAIDIRKHSSITDYVIVAQGNVDRHVTSIGRAIQDALKEKGERPIHVEGMQTGDWVVLDYGTFIIHLFMPEMREKYHLESLWSDSEIVDLEIDIKDAISS